MLIVCEMLPDFLLYVFGTKNVTPTNRKQKESENQPIGDKDKKLLSMVNVKFGMCLAIYYTNAIVPV